MIRPVLNATALATCLMLLIGHQTARAQTSQSCLVRTPGLQGGYTGDCVAGYASGKGRAKGVDAYEGGFRDGHPTGTGVYTFADGRRFEGEFANGKVNGRARFVYANGDVLEGVFQDNTLTGTGRMQRANGQALLVQLKGNAMVVVGQAPPAQAATPESPAGANPSLADKWVARLDFDDFFPSYILSTATRRVPQQAAGTRDMGASRGSELGDMHAAEFLGKSNDRPSATARYVGNAGDAIYLGDPWGLVGIKYTNTVAGTKVSLKVTVDEIAETTEVEYELVKTGEYVLYPKLKYRYDKLRTVNQPFPVNVAWAVSVNGRPAGTQSAVARVRSIQDAPIFLDTARGVERLLWVFAGYVTEDAPWLDELIRDAFKGSNGAAIGYQDTADGVDRQVQAIYQMLRKRGVRYSSITTSSGTSDKVASQIVRFPIDSIRTAQANCVDGTVLLASILRKIGIEPLIVTGPGHALLGYFRVPPEKGVKPDLRFVETTMLGVADFPDSLVAGARKVSEWMSKSANDPVFQMVAVGWARAEGIASIPR